MLQYNRAVLFKNVNFMNYKDRLGNCCRPVETKEIGQLRAMLDPGYSFNMKDVIETTGKI